MRNKIGNSHNILNTLPGTPKTLKMFIVALSLFQIASKENVNGHMLSFISYLKFNGTQFLPNPI